MIRWWLARVWRLVAQGLLARTFGRELSSKATECAGG